MEQLLRIPTESVEEHTITRACDRLMAGKPISAPVEVAGNLRPAVIVPYDTAMAINIDHIINLLDADKRHKVMFAPIEIGTLLEQLIDRNERIAIWYKTDEKSGYNYTLWKGMAWDFPEEMKHLRVDKIFGSVPQSIVDADIINIRVSIPANLTQYFISVAERHDAQKPSKNDCEEGTE